MLVETGPPHPPAAGTGITPCCRLRITDPLRPRRFVPNTRQGRTAEGAEERRGLLSRQHIHAPLLRCAGL